MLCSIDVDNLTGSILAKEKILASQYMSASPAGPPSVTSGLKMSIQPAKPASPIEHLTEQQRKCYVFSAHNIFTTWCVPFGREFFISRSWVCLVCICSVHCSRKPKGGLRFP